MEQTDQTEQQLIAALRRLPIAVLITKRPTHYVWQCLDEQGTASSLANAASFALTFLIERLIEDAPIHAIITREE